MAPTASAPAPASLLDTYPDRIGHPGRCRGQAVPGDDRPSRRPSTPSPPSTRPSLPPSSPELGRPAPQPQADRQRELRQPGRPARDGELADATSTPRATPGHRFYAGCDNVDALEERADRARQQTLWRRPRLRPAPQRASTPISSLSGRSCRSGSRRRSSKGRRQTRRTSSPKRWEEVRQVLVNQTILGIALEAGGHLTHGFRPNISGKLFRTARYDVDPAPTSSTTAPSGAQARDVKPLDPARRLLAYPRLINFAKMREIADRSGRPSWSTWPTSPGLSRARCSPGTMTRFPYAHIVTTTTHKTLRGPRGGLVLCKDEFAESSIRAAPWSSAARSPTSWRPKPSPS